MAARKKAAGSPVGEPEYLAVGFLRRPHGTRGEIIMDVHTDFPEHLKIGRKLFISEDHRPMVLTGARRHQAGLLVSFDGLDTPEGAGMLRNQWVYAKRSEAPNLPAGLLYQHELLGMAVLDEQGTSLGTIREIIRTGANDVYVVKHDSRRELLLPAIPSVILSIDRGSRIVNVHVLEGLVATQRSEDEATDS